MNPLAAALAAPEGSRDEPAVPASRWRELLHRSEPAVAGAAALGLLRLALYENRFGPAEALLDHDTSDAFDAAVLAAALVGAREAAPRLREKLFAQPPQVAARSLRLLERLTDEELLPRLRRDAPDFADQVEAAQPVDAALRLASRDAPSALVAAAARQDVAGSPFLDRSGGGLPGLALLAAALGEHVLPSAALEALRRRDVAAAADAIRGVAGNAPCEGSAPRLARLHHAAARACADLLAAEAPRKAAFDPPAVAGLLHAVQARALQQPGFRSAVALWLAGDTELWTTCPAPETDPVPLLRELAGRDPARTGELLAHAALSWRLPALADEVVKQALEQGSVASFLSLRLAARLESPVLDALERHDVEGRDDLGLLCQLVSRRACAHVLGHIRRRTTAMRFSSQLVVPAFPVPEVLHPLRAVPALVGVELTTRLGDIRLFDPETPEVSLDAGTLLLHCHACGRLGPVEPSAVVAVDSTTVLDPPQPCAGCGATGNATAVGDPLPRASWFLGAMQPGESPREALARKADRALDPLLRAELLDLAGETAAADEAMQAATPEETRSHLGTALRLLMRRDQHVEVIRAAQQALADTERFLTDEEDAQVRAALVQSSKALGLPQPPFPGEKPDAPRPAARPAGPARNAPCPCGSGKKYKRCHGA